MGSIINKLKGKGKFKNKTNSFIYQFLPEIEKRIARDRSEAKKMNALIAKQRRSQQSKVADNEIPPSELALHSMNQDTVYRLVQVVGGVLALFFNLFYKKNDDMRLFMDVPERYEQTEKGRLTEKQQKERKALQTEHTQKSEIHDEKENQLRKEAERIEKGISDLDQKIDAKGGKPKLSSRAYVILVTIIALADGFAIAAAMLVLREPPLLTFAMTLGMVIALTATSHYAGMQMKSYLRDKKRWKPLVVAVMVILSFFIALFIGTARMTYLEIKTKQEFDGMLSMGFLLLNLFFFAVSLYLSFSTHTADPETTLQLRSLISELKQKRKQVRKIMKEKQRIQKKTDRKMNKLTKKHNKESEELERKEEQLREDAVEFTSNINRIKNLFESYSGQIESLYRKDVFEQRNLIYLQGHSPEYFKTEPKPLDLSFPISDFVYPMKNSFPIGEPDFIDHSGKMNKGYSYPETRLSYRSRNTKKGEARNELESHVVDHKAGENGFTKKLSFPIIILFLTLIIGGCNNYEPQTTAVACQIDNTKGARSHEFMLTSSDILKMMDIDPNEKPDNGGIFLLTTINDVSRNAYRNTKLDKGNKWINPFSRLDSIKVFTNRVNKDIQWALTQDRQYNGTRFHTAFCDMAKKLSKLKADRKYILVYSDMAENSNVSFYKTFHNDVPDYDALISELEKESVMPDLSGIEVIIVYHTTDIQLDNIARKIQSFWEYYLQKMGAKVTFTASL